MGQKERTTEEMSRTCVELEALLYYGQAFSPVGTPIMKRNCEKHQDFSMNLVCCSYRVEPGL